jgi:hypothetical protein
MMPIQIRIRIGIKTMPIHIRIQPQVLHMLENRAIIFIFIHSNASLQCFSFLISEKCVMILSILYSILKFHEKSGKIHLLGIYTDPDRPDPAKCCESDPIRIHIPQRCFVLRTM